MNDTDLTSTVHVTNTALLSSSLSSNTSSSSSSTTTPLPLIPPTTPLFPYCGLDLQKAELPVILLTTLLVNIVSFIVLFRMRGTCDSVDHLLVSLLNLNDLLTTVLFTVTWLVGLASCGDLLLTDGVCSVFGWLGSSLVMWSAFIVFIMASLRCLSLVKPFYYRSNINSRVVTRAAAGTFLFCVLLYLLPFTGQTKPFALYTENLICAVDFAPGGSTVLHRGFIGFISVMGLVTIAAVLVCNFLIIGTLRHHNVIHTTRAATQPPISITSNAVTKRRMFQRVTLVVSLVYVLCYLPFSIRVLADTIHDVDNQDHLVHSVTLSLLFLSPFLNPIVYGLFNKGFRDTLVRMVTCRKTDSSDNSNSIVAR